MTGEELRAARKKCGLTQAELAKMAGISVSMVSHYENGRYPVPQVLALAVVALRLERQFPGISKVLLP